jgi:dTMP kinase
MRRGLFLTFEGIDGCGKSTQTALLAAYLDKKGVEYIVTREPGGTDIAEQIREVILSRRNAAMGDACELLLYLAARAQHLAETIIPALDKGVVVLCDRFQEATFAYQGFGRGLPLDKLEQLNSFATGGLVPEKTFVFDISVERAFERMRNMNKKPDRLEMGSSEFYRRIREGYLSLASAHRHRIVLLQGDKPAGELFEEVRAVVDRLLSQRE